MGKIGQVAFASAALGAGLAVPATEALHRLDVSVDSRLLVFAALASSIGALLVFAGVVLPAVFMKDAVRRRDARAVLKLILDFVRGRGRSSPQ